MTSQEQRPISPYTLMEHIGMIAGEENYTKGVDIHHPSGMRRIVFDHKKQVLAIAIKEYNPMHFPQLSSICPKIGSGWNGEIAFRSHWDETNRTMRIEATILGDHDIDLAFTGAEGFALETIEAWKTIPETLPMSSLNRKVVTLTTSLRHHVHDTYHDLHLGLFNDALTANDAFQAFSVKIDLMRHFGKMSSDGIITTIYDMAKRLNGKAMYHVSNMEISPYLTDVEIRNKQIDPWKETRRVLDYSNIYYPPDFTVTAFTETPEMSVSIRLYKGKYTMWVKDGDDFAKRLYSSKIPLKLPRFPPSQKMLYKALTKSLDQCLGYISIQTLRREKIREILGEPPNSR